MLSAVSLIGNEDGLTPDELKALGLPDSFRGPAESDQPVGPNVFGWIVILAPLGLLSGFESFGSRAEASGRSKVTATQATFWSFSLLMGPSLALLFHYSDAAARLCFLVGALCIAAWSHRAFLDRHLGRAAKTLLIVSILALVNWLRSGSLFMGAVPLFVLGIVAFAILLLDDVRRLGRDDAGRAPLDPVQAPAYEALNLYLGLAGLALSVAALANGK